MKWWWTRIASRGGYVLSFLAVSVVLSSEGDWCAGRMLYDVVAYQQLQLVPLTSKVSAESRKLGCGFKV